jgi:hypothetical protein
MKSRSREVNIFNMSLLDVLCGALGAFCFMMLALFPYYKPSHLSAEDKQSYQNAQQMQQELQQLRSELQQVGPSGSAEMLPKIQRTLNAAQQQLSQTQESLNRTRAAMEEAQQQSSKVQRQLQQALTSANHTNAVLAMKHPLVVECWFLPNTNKVTMYIHDPDKGTNGKFAPPFDPSREQGAFFTNSTVVEGPGRNTWVIGDTTPGNYAVYYRLDKPQSVTGEASVEGLYILNGVVGDLPLVKLTAAHPYAEAGSIVLDAKGGTRFILASASGSAANSATSPTQTPR